jgi:hypothetical protein
MLRKHACHAAESTQWFVYERMYVCLFFSDLMMVSSSWLELLIIDTYCCCSNVRDVSLNKRPMPRTYTQTSTITKQNMSLSARFEVRGGTEEKHC